MQNPCTDPMFLYPCIFPGDIHQDRDRGCIEPGNDVAYEAYVIFRKPGVVRSDFGDDIVRVPIDSGLEL